MYKKSIDSNATEDDITKYREYRNDYSKLKRTAQATYYANKVKECKNKTKDLWKLINKVIRKVKNRGSIISHIAIDGLKTYNPKWIANEFGRFYSNIGENLAAKIKPGLTSTDEYLVNIKRVDASLVMKSITQLEIEKLIEGLPNKTSYGHDKISNVLSKQLSTSISFPLCAIFIQSLATGIFPNAMKKVEIIPLYKGKEFNKVVKYHPVSLLLTISKVLEKAVI